MTIFLVSLAGIPPLGGWFAKFVHLPVAGLGRHDVGLRARRARRRQLGDRRSSTTPGSLRLHVVRGRPRRRPHPDPGAGLAAPIAAGAHRRRHPGRTASFPGVVTHFTDPVSLRRPRPLTAGRRPGRPWCRPLDDEVADRIRRHGPIRGRRGASTWRCTTPTDGFYGAGRSAPGDGATSSPAPRSGPLFGAVMARALDELVGRARPPRSRSPWSRPAPGRARWPAPCCWPSPACAAALTYVLVERVARRCATGTPSTCRWRSGAGLPAGPATTTTTGRRTEPVGTGPRCRVAGRAARPSPWSGWWWPTSCSTTWPSALLERAEQGWHEVRLGARPTASCRWSRCWCRPATADAALAEPAGARRRRRVPGSRCSGRRPAWLADALRPARAGPGGGDRLRRRPRRSWRPARGPEWVRTYRAHAAGRHPGSSARHPGHHLRGRRRPARARAPAPTSGADPGRASSPPTASTSWSTRADAIWDERAHVGDLDALRARSRVAEAEALTDPDGLGGFRVPRVGSWPDRRRRRPTVGSRRGRPGGPTPVPG